MPQPQPARSQELEGLIRRLIRQELVALLHSPVDTLEEWKRQSVDDPDGDALLLRDALAVLEAEGDDPEAWMSWDEVEAELDRAEAAGELPY